MTWLLKAASSSIGKKQCMALTGLALCGFLVAHLAGNLLLLSGPEKFNAYAEYLEHNPLLVPAEIGLILLFGAHIALAMTVTRQNWAARPQRYAVRASEGGRTFASGTMWISGLVTLVFLIVHLINFRFASEEARSDLYHLVTTTFHSLPYVVWYVAAVCILGFHVAHGLQSALRSLGIAHPRYTPILLWVSRVFGVVVAGGYSLLPIYAYLYTRTAA